MFRLDQTVFDMNHMFDGNGNFYTHEGTETPCKLESG